MLLKAGVDISRLNREIRRALGKLAGLFADLGVEIVVTETYGGNHGSGSLHYANDAFDVRFPGVYSVETISLIRKRLGPKFDIVGESDHIHVEYDPK